MAGDLLWFNLSLALCFPNMLQQDARPVIAEQADQEGHDSDGDKRPADPEHDFTVEKFDKTQARDKQSQGGSDVGQKRVLIGEVGAIDREMIPEDHTSPLDMEVDFLMNCRTLSVTEKPHCVLLLPQI